VGQVKGILSLGIYSRGELDNNSKPNQTRAKGSPSVKHCNYIKSYSLILRVKLQKGVDDVGDDDDE
jgi:hypothetical protein